MNIGYLSYKSIISRPLSSFLSWMLLGFGVTVVVLILLISRQLEKEISKNAKGIDLVIGAKGSPLQLILANVFHVDFPTGNISLKEAAAVSRNRLIASAIPLSLGDSYLGSRIVGTTPAYADLYEGKLESGKWYEQPMEAVIGAKAAEKLQLKLGSEFSSQHGLASDGDAHEGHPFVVSGILQPTNTILDDLILTSIQSIWHVHAHDEEGEAETDSLVNIPHLGVTVSVHELAEEEITSLLIKYKSPMGAVTLPRKINTETPFQAASPAFEAARLFSIIGVGVKVMNLLGLAIIIISAISVFVALLNSLKERRFDIAVMRSMGAGKSQVFFLILIEGLIITFAGVISGLAIAHVLVYALGQWAEGINPEAFYFIQEEFYVMAGCLLIGLLAALIPAVMAYQTDISKTLSKST